MPCADSHLTLQDTDLPTTPLILVHHVTRSVEECEFKRVNRTDSWRAEQLASFCELEDATIEDRICADFSSSVRQQMLALAPDWCTTALKLTPHT
jgi:hypothetical protein